jgi:hypothetical protein
VRSARKRHLPSPGTVSNRSLLRKTLEVAKSGKCEIDVEGTRVRVRGFKLLGAELSNREGQSVADTGVVGDDVRFDGGS